MVVSPGPVQLMRQRLPPPRYLAVPWQVVYRYWRSAIFGHALVGNGGHSARCQAEGLLHSRRIRHVDRHVRGVSSMPRRPRAGGAHLVELARRILAIVGRIFLVLLGTAREERLAARRLPGLVIRSRHDRRKRNVRFRSRRCTVWLLPRWMRLAPKK